MPSVSSVEEASAVFAEAFADGRTLRIGDDVSADGMQRVLEHDPGDLTCTVEAGLRLSALQELLAASGQRLSLDPPGDPTVGAIVARNLSGPLRHRFGAPRDLVLGTTLVLADGTVASAGGKVVKNVAGYDLARLVCGSEGRLAFVARVSFRLHPLPKASRTLVVETDDAARATATLLRSQLQPSALDVLHPGRVAVLLEGSAARGRRPARLGSRARRRRARRTTRCGTSRGRVRRRHAARVRFAPGELGATLAGLAEAVVRPASGVAYTREPSSDTVSEGQERLLERIRGAARPGGVLRRMIREYTSDCVHCGFCLPTCPTYVLWSEEMDSPRGRIHLMDALLDGTIEAQRDGRQALRPLPRMHGLRLGVPVGRPLRPPHREHAPRRRGGGAALGGRRLRPRPALPRPAVPVAHARGARPRHGRSRCPDAEAPPRARRHRSSLARRRRRGAHHAGQRTAARARRHAHRLRAAGRLLGRERGDRARARGRRVRGGCATAGLLRSALACMRGASRRASASPGSSSTPSTTSISSPSTPPAAAPI